MQGKMKDWSDCKNILCIRADNMGDLLMSSPAIRALKQSFSCKITVLTSSMAGGIASLLPGIDEVLICNLPWVKTDSAPEPEEFFDIVQLIRQKRFDAAVVFTVYSQNPLPAVMLAYLAGIPLRLAYCRENPYLLLTHWVPDAEPYSFVRHQVQRDLDLVKFVGASTQDDRLILKLDEDCWPAVRQKLVEAGIDSEKPWLILHAGVSEQKREYPFASWVDAGTQIVRNMGYQVLLTGVSKEKDLTDRLRNHIGKGAFSLAGLFGLEEYIHLIGQAPLVVSVNTGTVHIAAATATPLVVLYALTNPQHLPWKTRGKALFYSIPEDARSRNEVIRYVHKELFTPVQEASTDELVQAVADVLGDPGKFLIPAMVPLQTVPG